jgi:hypothetical protein
MEGRAVFAPYLNLPAMEFVLFWIICGIVAGFIGGKKGQGCAGFAAGALLGHSAQWSAGRRRPFMPE